MSYQYDTAHNSPNYTPEADSTAVFGQPRVIKGITIHWWGDPSTNPSFAGVRDYLCRINGDTSAHLVVTGDNRQVACIVNYNDVAWHAGNATGNATTIGIECDPRCRDEDYDVIAEVVADIRSAFGNVPIYSHNMWVQTTCPGNYDISRIDKLSYTKQSNAQWGQVTDKTPPAVPPVVPTPSIVTPTPAPHQTNPAPGPSPVPLPGPTTPVIPPIPVLTPPVVEPPVVPPTPTPPVVPPVTPLPVLPPSVPTPVLPVKKENPFVIALKELVRMIVFSLPAALIQIMTSNPALTLGYGGTVLIVLKYIDSYIQANPNSSLKGLLPF